MQWEVEQALQRDTTPRLAAQVETASTPLDELLDPTGTGNHRNVTAKRDLFLRFAVASLWPRKYCAVSTAPYFQP